MKDRLLRWFPLKALQDISILTVGRSVAYGTGFLYGVFGAYILGAGGFGQLVLIMAVVRMFSLPVNFQLSSPLLKLVREGREVKSGPRNRDFIRASFVVQAIGVFVFCMVFLPVLWFSAPWFELFGNWQIALGLFALADGLQIQRNTVRSLFMAYEKFNWVASYVIWQSICRDVLVVGFMYFGGVQGACLGYLVGELLIYAVTVCVGLVVGGRSLREALWDPEFVFTRAVKELYRNARSNYVATIITKAYREISHLLIGGFVGTAGAGYYNIALKFKRIFTFMTGPVTTYLFPRFVGKWAQESRDEFYYTLRKYFYQLGPTFLLAAGALIALAPWLVPLFYSDDFVEAIPLVIVLVPFFALNSLFGIFSQMTFVISQQRALVIEGLIKSIIGLPVAFGLIYSYGYLGAAWALAIQIALIVLYRVYFFQQHFGWRWILPG